VNFLQKYNFSFKKQARKQEIIVLTTLILLDSDKKTQKGGKRNPQNFGEQRVQTGVFSVSSTKQVVFSQGNLQATYNGSAWSWAFLFLPCRRGRR